MGPGAGMQRTLTYWHTCAQTPHASADATPQTMCVCVCNVPMMVHAVLITCRFSTSCTHAPKQRWLGVTGDSTDRVDAERSARGLR